MNVLVFLFTLNCTAESKEKKEKKIIIWFLNLKQDRKSIDKPLEKSNNQKVTKNRITKIIKEPTTLLNNHHKVHISGMN